MEKPKYKQVWVTKRLLRAGFRITGSVLVHELQADTVENPPSVSKAILSPHLGILKSIQVLRSRLVGPTNALLVRPEDESSLLEYGNQQGDVQQRR